MKLMGMSVDPTDIDRQTFVNQGEHGRIIVRCQDGASIIIAPGESATVWTHGGKFYHRRQTWWRRVAHWWRETGSALFRRRAR